MLDTVSSGDAKANGLVTVNAQILDREGLIVKLGPYLEKIFPLVPARAAGLTRNDIAKPGVAESAYGWVPSAAGNSVVRALPRVRNQLPLITCPSLIMYSRQDHSVPPANSQALVRLVPDAAGARARAQLPRGHARLRSRAHRRASDLLRGPCWRPAREPDTREKCSGNGPAAASSGSSRSVC